MKIGISADGKNLEDRVSEVFARCPYFIIAEIENGKIKNFEAIENETGLGRGGAGIFAAKLMAERDVKAVITKNIGPRAFEVLKQFNIEVYQGEGEIKKAIEEFIQGKLKNLNENSIRYRWK